MAMKPYEKKLSTVTLTGEYLGGCKVTIITNPKLGAFADLDQSKPSTWLDFFEGVIDSWEGFVDDEGKPLPFSRDALKELSTEYIFELQAEVNAAIAVPQNGSNETT
jgi:hypothetical protein